MLSELRPALVVFVGMTIITGVAYPLAVTGIAQGLWPKQANGSIIGRDSRAVGSSLIGQEFSGNPRYFWGRPSATSPVPYTAFNADTETGSSGSNLGPTNPALIENVESRIKALAEADAEASYTRPPGTLIPVDLVTASGSGLDPHISCASATYQLGRVASARGMPEAQVQALVEQHTRGRGLGILGEPVVNVLELNLALDSATSPARD